MEKKEKIIQELLNNLIASYKKTLAEISSVSAAAIDAPGRNESRYDTAKVELGYLASSLSKKAADMEMDIKELQAFSLLKNYDNITLGSLVFIINHNVAQTLFFLPVGGGQKFISNNDEIIVIGKKSPLFLAMHGKKIGETIIFNNRKIEIRKIE